jgi:subfamily B ATP-binding cassette protein MsbA
VAQMKIVKYAQALTPAIEVLSAVGIAATLVFAHRMGVKWETFVSILVALYMCYEPIKKVGALNSELRRGEASLDRLEVVLNEPVMIADPAQPVTVGRLRGDLSFEQVSFAYDGDNRALRDVSVRIPAGTVCALVGPSGAGKTTFANLVPRFYDATAGTVKVDGVDVRALRLSDLRRNIALVSQEPVLFNDTIFNNLQLGREDATRDEVMAAAIDAHADDFIRTLPNGYETTVGERGALLSGGQKQRVAIARAFLRNAPILILDEATSALDSDSEAAVQDALRKLVAGKTVLIIAHRFSTIRDATLILVFDQGRITATGDHAALYAGNALYKSLYDRQQGSG